jgi:hypothetical protein
MGKLNLKSNISQMTELDKIKKYDLVLQKYIDNKSYIKIYRTVCGKEEDLSGFLLGMSKDFMFFQLASDLIV